MHTSISNRIPMAPMLITQPSIMWTHGRFWLLAQLFCNWLSLLFPKVFVLALMTWALYAFLLLVDSGVQRQWMRLLLDSTMVLLYLLSLYTYFMVIVAGPGLPADFPELRVGSYSTPENPYADNTTGSHSGSRESSESANGDTAHLLPESSQSSASNRNPPSEIFTSHSFKNNAPAYRWCSTCGVWKPDRCHHCSTCNRCFLRMDHHCPWFACCIGFRNHKFFVQVLMYMTFFSLEALVVSFSLLYQFFVDEQWDNNHYLSLHLVFLFVVSVAFSVSMSLFTAFSIYMVLRNLTTIEFQDNRWGYLEHSTGQYEFDLKGKKKLLGHLYDLGWKKNWTAVMGQSIVGWILPLTVAGHSLSAFGNNGINFDVDEELYNKYVYNAQLQDQLNQQLAEYRDRIRGAPSGQ